MTRVLWVGDAACSTGFARCTHAVCDELHRAGWDVHVLGINYFGDPHDHPYQIYPCRQPLDGGFDLFGVGRLPILMERLRPDLVVLLNDPWNVPEYLTYIRQFAEELGRRGQSGADRVLSVPIVGWLAVDSQNQEGQPLNDLEHVAVWTRFAARELQEGGYRGSPSVVPLGVDHGVFSPQAGARKAIDLPAGIPDDAYLVGVVGRNQPRKRLDLAIRYFAKWVSECQVEDAYLYLHIAPTGEMGCDIQRLSKYYGLKGRVLLRIPHVGHGDSDGQVASLYSALDCLLSTTQGEGWALPVLEAMACGTPCIVPDWSALGDWPGDAVRKVPCTSTAVSAPTSSRRGPYTIGGIAGERETICALDELYRSREVRGRYRQLGIARAAEFSWQRTGSEMREVLESVLRDRKEATA